MLKRLAAVAVLALAASTALAATTGPTKPGARLSYRAPPSEGVVAKQHVQPKERLVLNKMPCSCHLK